MFKTAIELVLFASIATAQQRSESHVDLLTVCDVLDNVDRYAGAGVAVAVVGRLERSVSVIDHYEFLAQERCARPVVTYGHVWSNKIQIWTFAEEGMPRPPADKPMLDRTTIAAKLAAVRQTTKLGTHTVPGTDAHGKLTNVVVPNDWAVVYGRIVPSPRLKENCGPRDCGGFNVPLILMAEPDQVHRLRADGTQIPEHD